MGCRLLHWNTLPKLSEPGSKNCLGDSDVSQLRLSIRCRYDRLNEITKVAQIADHLRHTTLRSVPSDGWATLFVSDALVQNQPDQSAYAMCNSSDRLRVPEPRHETFIDEFKDTSFGFNCCIGCLIQ